MTGQLRVVDGAAFDPAHGGLEAAMRRGARARRRWVRMELPDWARSSSCLLSVLKESDRAVELTGCRRNSGVSRVVRRTVARLRPADRGNGGAKRASTAGAGADGANREFGKMIAQGGHVTPSIESNPITACTRIGIHRFFEAEEVSEKDNIYSKIQ